MTIHAGEAFGLPSIWEAVQFCDAERLGHGVRITDDITRVGDGYELGRLASYIRDRRIPLEVCPTSNVCTRSVPSLDEHPLPDLVSAGVLVTINSDDPPMFSTTLNNEYAVAAGLLQLDEAGVADLARAAVNASFLDSAGKAELLAEINDYAVSSVITRVGTAD